MKRKKINKTILLSFILINLLIGVFITKTKNSLAETNNQITENTNDAVSTYEATEKTDIGAKLNGSIVPSAYFPAGTDANVYFRYSAQTDFPPVFCNDIYGSSVRSTKEIKPKPTLTTGKTTYFSTPISNLSQNTTYFYCAIASNEKNIVYGEVSKFTTLPDKTLSVSTKTPLVASGTSVFLNGFYNTTSAATTWFEYRKIDNSALSASKSISKTTSSLDSKQAFSVSKTTTSSLASKQVSWSTKLNSQSHNKNTSEDVNYKLSGLTPNTSYEYHFVIKLNNSNSVFYGNNVAFITLNSSTTDTGGNNSYTASGTLPPLTLGQTATPPDDAIVHYHEGIETVFTRQIIKNTQLAKAYGYTDGDDLQTFAWGLSDTFARMFGYVSSNGKEIRVSPVDRAAYELRYENNKLTVYEYLDSKIVNIQTETAAMRNKYGYEYYFNKK